MILIGPCYEYIKIHTFNYIIHAFVNYCLIHIANGRNHIYTIFC